MYGIEGVPRPDVLVYNTNQCRDVQDWFSFYQRHYRVPLLGIQTPRSVEELSGEMVQGLMAQYRALIPALEEVSGQRLDMDRLKEVVALSAECSRLWNRVLHRARHRPSPLTFFDGTIHMGPAVVLRGDARALTYYQLLLAEIEERLASAAAAVEQEALRLYWEGMPVWGKLREHAELFAQHRACVVASTYCHSWCFAALGLPDPWEGMARAYTELFIVRSEAYKEQYLTAMVRDYAVDALIYHEAKTCPNNSNSRYTLAHRLQHQLELPFIVLHGDLNDLRLYSQEQSCTQIEALMEILEERAQRRASGLQ
jgi:benzoyl-CoA reductase/2-hydroxyglutaryl-CoA dehydratase subunit BcrC/BadD/HgdB